MIHCIHTVYISRSGTSAISGNCASQAWKRKYISVSMGKLKSHLVRGCEFEFHTVLILKVVNAQAISQIGHEVEYVHTPHMLMCTEREQGEFQSNDTFVSFSPTLVNTLQLTCLQLTSSFSDSPSKTFEMHIYRSPMCFLHILKYLS